MIREYTLKLRMNTDDGSYSLVLDRDVIATVTPDEPVTAPDALRMLLGITP